MHTCRFIHYAYARYRISNFVHDSYHRIIMLMKRYDNFSQKLRVINYHFLKNDRHCANSLLTLQIYVFVAFQRCMLSIRMHETTKHKYFLVDRCLVSYILFPFSVLKLYCLPYFIFMGINYALNYELFKNCLSICTHSSLALHDAIA